MPLSYMLLGGFFCGHFFRSTCFRPLFFLLNDFPSTLQGIAVFLRETAVNLFSFSFFDFFYLIIQLCTDSFFSAFRHTDVIFGSMIFYMIYLLFFLFCQLYKIFGEMLFQHVFLFLHISFPIIICIFIMHLVSRRTFFLLTKATGNV